MLQVNEHQKHGVTLDELFFAEDSKNTPSKADISTFMFCKTPPDINVPYKIKTNMGIDLLQSREEILTHYPPKQHKRSLRILESGKFTIERTQNPSEEEMQEFCTFFNIFANNKGIYNTTCENLMVYVKKNAYLITKIVENSSGETMAYLSHILVGKRATSHISCTHLRLSDDSVYVRLQSDANKALYLANLFYLKENGMEIMDFGGYRMDENGKPLTGVDEFKRRFGGYIIKEYCFFYPRTLKGKLALPFMNRDVKDL